MVGVGEWKTSQQGRAERGVPPALRTAFIVHFAVDMIVGIPLLVFSTGALDWLGWVGSDPLFVRLFAAALLAIGLESFLGRDATVGVYTHMLNLKIAWSLWAWVAILVSLVQSSDYRSIPVWTGLFIFLGFHILWVYWRIALCDRGSGEA